MYTPTIDNNTPKPLDCQYLCQEVHLYAPLSAAAFRKKQTIELVLWHCLRSLNSWGSGVLPFEMAIEGLVSVFGYSPKTAYRHLAKGNNRFWSLTYHNAQRRIQIYGLKQVCEYLDTYLIGDRHSRGIPASEFNTLVKRRSQLYASIHKPGGIRANPISRASLEESTGLSRIQQRRYESAAGVHRTPNFSVRGTDKGYAPVKEKVTTKSETYYVNKRLGNTYHSKQSPGHIGQGRKVSARLRHNGSFMSVEAPPKPLRRFFTGLKRLMRTRAKLWDSHYLTHSRHRIIPGRVEWCLIESI